MITKLLNLSVVRSRYNYVAIEKVTQINASIQFNRCISLLETIQLPCFKFNKTAVKVLEQQYI